MVPGFGPPNLYVNNGNTFPIAAFPITYDQKQACNNVVYTSALVDSVNSNYVYGKLYVWKDYIDNLYVTVSINATGFGPGATASQVSESGESPEV